VRSPGLLRLALAAGVFAIGIDAVVASGLLPGITSSLVISSGHAGSDHRTGMSYALRSPAAPPRPGPA
jgi:predicted MFS family arabinose efflux permease